MLSHYFQADQPILEKAGFVNDDEIEVYKWYYYVLHYWSGTPLVWALALYIMRYKYLYDEPDPERKSNEIVYDGFYYMGPTIYA